MNPLLSSMTVLFFSKGKFEFLLANLSFFLKYNSFYFLFFFFNLYWNRFIHIFLIVFFKYSSLFDNGVHGAEVTWMAVH